MKYGQSPKFPAPVIALTIIDISSSLNLNINFDSRMLVVVRNPKTNINHPNVVSTPTQRIPDALHKEINEQVFNAPNQKNRDSNIEQRVWDNQSENGHNPIIYAVESLLSKKLGISELLETNQINFKVKFGTALVDRSYHQDYINNEKIPHYISMLNLLVYVYKGSNLFPFETSSYSKIIWTDVEKFLEMLKEKNPIEISKDLNPFEYCVHGLCLSTSQEVLIESLKTRNRS